MAVRSGKFLVALALAASPACIAWNALPEAAGGSAAVCGQLIAHAGGAVGQASLTNSREALDTGYLNGHRSFEVDLDFTSDGVPVLSHHWGPAWWSRSRVPYPFAPTLAQFMAGRPSGLMPMALDDLSGWIGGHPDAEIFVDLKGGRERSLAALAALPDAVKGRMVPQVRPSQLSAASGKGFKEVAVTAYGAGLDDGQVLALASNRGVGTVVVPEARLGLAARLAAMGVRAVVHTVNDAAAARRYAGMGVAVMTDVLVPCGFQQNDQACSACSSSQSPAISTDRPRPHALMEP